MFYDKVANIYKKAVPTKFRGELVFGSPILIGPVKCDIQPYNSKLALKEYGYDIQVTKRMFCDITTLTPGDYLVEYLGKKYEVKEIPWDDGFLEVLLDG